MWPNVFTGSDIPDVIQTDTTINHGNSGGPLLSSKGQVVGINSYSLSVLNLTGINFAIPSDLVARVAPQIVQTGKYDNPWLGFSLAVSLTPTLSQSLGLPRDYKGVVIYAVAPNGPLDKAGKRGYSQSTNNGRRDIIRAIDGHAVRDLDQLDAYVAEHTSVGNNVTFSIDRNGKQMEIQAIIQARPTPSQ